MKDYGWLLIVGLILLAMWQKQKTEGQNAEEWTVQRDERGRVSGLVVTRHYTAT